MNKVAEYVRENPWMGVGIAFAAGAIYALELPGTRLIGKLARGYMFRELTGRLLPMAA